MHIAHWCLLMAALLPIGCTAIAKLVARRHFSNVAPRVFLANLTGVAQRANWAQMNSFEAFPMFAVAVLAAEQAGAASASVDQLALAFIATRVAYIACYLADWASLRSLVWFGGLACVVWLFVLAL